MKSLFQVLVFAILATTSLLAQTNQVGLVSAIANAKVPDEPGHIYQPVIPNAGMKLDTGACTLDGLPMFLPDNYVGSFSVAVQGATNPILGVNGQGVCGVRITLDHEYIGDLLIKLTSPSGQTVTLIGPAGLFGATDFTIWDVIFRPCDSAISPDPGYSAVWNNNQAWGMGNYFSGEYYPESGCLESFMGSVNGIWTLTVTDAQASDAGTLYDFEVLFCDASGIDCISCSSVATTLPDVVVCQEDLPYTWNQPPYTVVSVPGTSILESTPFTAVSGCDSLVRQAIIVLNPVAQINATGTILTCAQPTIYLYSAASPGALKTWVNVANNTTQAGDSYAATSPGMYILNVSRTLNGVECTQSDTIVIDFSPNLLPVTITGGVIGCNQSTTVIAAAASGFGLQYSWSGPEGFTSVLPAPVVSVPGVYTVTVTGGQGCSGTQTVTVTKQEPPSIAVSISPLGCTTPATILLSATVPFVAYSWSGPNGFNAVGPLISPNQPGFYIVTITPSTGCVSVDSLWLAPASGSLILSPVNDIISCETTFANLFCGSEATSPIYSWTGPNGFTSSFAQPYIEVPGVYSVTITDQLSLCSGTASVVITADTTAPEIDSIAVIHPVIGQSNGSIQLAVSGATEPFTYFWTFNGSFFAVEEDIFNLSEGPYQCVVTAANGCTKILSVELMGTSGTNEMYNTANWTLAPNPGDGHFVLSRTGKDGSPAAMYLYDIAGKLVWQQAEQWVGKDHSLDFSNLPAGQYWLRLTGAQGTVLLKPIINK